MKKLSRIIITSFLSMTPALMNAQVLITILLGDKLNSDKMEFGLLGGMSRSYINDISGSKGLNNLDLGFYFHILIKNNSYLSTGLRVKSGTGAKGMPTYQLGDASFDDVFQEGTLTKKINCFYLPILFHQRFNNRLYIEAGPQVGLIHNPKDIFKVSDLGGDLTYTRSVKDEYKHIDAGLLGSVGFKFRKAPKSISAGISYYYGLVNISNNPEQEIKNSALYFFIKIPIGGGKSNKPEE